MPNDYVRIPNAPDRRNREIDDEVQAAFDYREEDDDDHDSSESRPLNQASTRSGPASNPPPPIQVPQYDQPAAYNFDSVDYDFPPPGSPPPPSSSAFPNDHGNSNGYIPVFDGTSTHAPRPPWWKRAASVLPEGVRDRLGLGSSRPAGPVGSGVNNDGVFANVVAKPTAPVRVQDGDDTYVVPEDAQADAPPSYAVAQADAVPPYWETTVHAPFAPDSMGDMIVDNLPTGSLFSFCWNMLVSISFQFVGFLLTYLLHTSHAARLGSRAGLGVTLIQYGFALRGKLDGSDDYNNDDPWPAPTADSSSPLPVGSSYGGQGGAFNSTAGLPEDQAVFLANATTEWLSFFLMTIGWFVLLTSLLGFYRVKRWEQGILASQQATQRSAPTPTTAPTFVTGFEQNFALHGMSRIELLRQGLGLRNQGAGTPDASDRTDNNPNTPPAVQIVGNGGIVSPPLDPNDPRTGPLIREMGHETRLRNSLRESGFL